MQTQSGTRVAAEARAVVQDVRQCAAGTGATLESATARPESERTNQEQALVEAEQIDKDIAELSAILDRDQLQLNGYLRYQTASEEHLNKMISLQRSFREAYERFISLFTQLSATSDALVEISRNLIPISPSSARLQENEIATVRELLVSLQSMRDLLEQNGIDATGLNRSIASAQTFLGQASNPERELDWYSMIVDMRLTASNLPIYADRVSEMVSEAQLGLDSLTGLIQGAFAEQRAALSALSHALDRANAARAACVGNPFFGLNPLVPSWDSTFWDISSP